MGGAYVACAAPCCAPCSFQKVSSFFEACVITMNMCECIRLDYSFFFFSVSLSTSSFWTPVFWQVGVPIFQKKKLQRSLRLSFIFFKIISPNFFFFFFSFFQEPLLFHNLFVCSSAYFSVSQWLLRFLYGNAFRQLIRFLSHTCFLATSDNNNSIFFRYPPTPKLSMRWNNEVYTRNHTTTLASSIRTLFTGQSVMILDLFYPLFCWEVRYICKKIIELCSMRSAKIGVEWSKMRYI